MTTPRSGTAHYFARPLYVVWEITHLCHARCVHCYSDAGPDARTPELSTAEALRVVDEVADVGVLVLGFSGGEALLRPDWRELVGRAVARGLRTTIGSNGQTLTGAVVRDLKALGVHNVTVSLDGARAEIHDRVRGVPGLFEHAVAGIRRLVAAGVPVTVGFTPTTLNHREGRAVVALAESLGVGKANLSTYVPVGRGGLELALTSGQLKQVLDEWIEMQRLHAPRMKILWHDCRVSLLVPPAASAKYVGCGAGVVTCRITVAGHVTPCVSLLLPAGDLKLATFREIWERSPLLGRIRDRANIRDGNCGPCEHKLTCGGCRSLSLAYHGDAFGGDRYCWIKPEDAAPAAAAKA